MYKDNYSNLISEKICYLKKKDSALYERLRKKIDEILISPLHDYKFLRYNLKKLNRVHIGHFVLVFLVDHNNQTIYFEDFDHHDKIYF